uniref:Flavonoid 3' hydroxylase-like protein n=1 Tax=Fagopyrum tataricum TaxID=62330 RepID=A0A088FG01_FAGTA|nr:flavonoid 3' hydroxylase-like protein [Fagopyrum tataricum]
MEFYEMMIFYIFVAASIFFLFLFKRSRKITKNSNLPPSPPGLPIIGHLHLLKRDYYHRSLEELANQYGPTLYLRLGSCPVLVVSSPRAAEQCLTKNDVIFANRPNFMVGQVLGYDFSITPWAPYGELWRNLRRLITLEALSPNRIHQLAGIRQEEVRFITREMFLKGNQSGQIRVKADLNAAFLRLVRNVMVRIVSGKRWDDYGPEDDDLFKPTAFMTTYDFLPFLRWVGYDGMEKSFLELNWKRDEYLQGLLDEFKKKMNHQVKENGGVERKPFMVEELLALQKADPQYYTDDILKGILLVMYTAGTDTSARIMEWAMSLLLNHPTILRKARAEIDAHVPTTRLVEDSDLSNLPYLRCIIYETLRLYPVVSLLIPHFSSSETTIDGYRVPKGTVLVVNAWALHRNPEVWPEPLEFRPERFEGVEGNRDGFKFMPFGVGRRACPGANLGVKMVALTLATMIQGFEWENVEAGEVDVEEEGGGITMPKRSPLKAFCTPRSCMLDVLSMI